MYNKATRQKLYGMQYQSSIVCVGIDVAKIMHDCFILNSEGEVLADVLTIANNRDGFKTLLRRIRYCSQPTDNIKVGLETRGQYSYNILEFLLNNGLHTFVLNPLHTNLNRKSHSLRKTKTDRIDARTIAAMLMSNVDLKSTDTAYHNEEYSHSQDTDSMRRKKEPSSKCLLPASSTS